MLKTIQGKSDECSEEVDTIKSLEHKWIEPQRMVGGLLCYFRQLKRTNR